MAMQYENGYNGVGGAWSQDVQVAGDFVADGDVIINGTLMVDGNIRINGKLDVKRLMCTGSVATSKKENSFDVDDDFSIGLTD